MTRRSAVVWALLTSASLLLVLSGYSELSPQHGSTVASVLQAQTAAQPVLAAGCMEGVVTVQDGGRLGNKVLEYASAATVAWRHHLRLAVPSVLFDPLSAIFDNLTAETLSQLLQQPPCRGLNLTEEEVLHDRNKPPELPSMEKTVEWAQSKHLPVVLRSAIIKTDYIASSLEFLRQELRFREEIKSAANKKLNKIISETARKTGFNKTQVCTVGVHVRRTDYTKYMRRRFHLRQEAGLAYYTAAAAAMLSDLRSECAAVAFAVTSDDNRWCRKQLLPALTRSASEDAVASVGFLMSSRKPADDLCLLSSCQHLIMAYGTFGLTAAILSSGQTIMYDTEKHGASPQPAAQSMTSLVPHWRLVS